jgi:hypothetical protein
MLFATLATTALMPTPRWQPSLPHGARAHFGHAVQMNLFGDIFDDSRLKPQKPPAQPLLPSLVRHDAAAYVLRESMFSFSGEDFRVRDILGNEARPSRAHRNPSRRLCAWLPYASSRCGRAS